MNNPAAPKNTPETWKAWWSANWKALLGVVILGLLPFLPVLFSGQILFSSDQMNSSSAKWYFDALRHGEIPLWIHLLYGGMPTFDAMSGDASYPFFVLLGFLLPIVRVVTADFILHLLIAGLSAYVLLQRYFRLNTWLATALSVAYMLNTNFISNIYSGHTAKFFILSWLPLSLYCLLRSLGPRASWKHLLGLSLSVALFISTSHLQYTYYVLMGYFLVWLYFLVPPLRAKQFGEAGSLLLRFWVPILLGLGLTFVVLYPPLNYNKEFSVRGVGMRTTYEYATSWSIHPEETASLVVPEFGGLNENYWGRNYFKLNSEYPGLLVWFLGLLGLLAFRTRWFWFWGGVGLLSIIFGLGADTPLFHLFYQFVPGMKTFRAPSMMLFWLATSLLLMSAETLRRFSLVGEGSLPEDRRKKTLTRLRIAGFSTAGVLLVCGLFPDLVYSIWNGMVDASQIPNFARQEMAKSAFAMGALRAGVLTGILTWAAAAFLLKSRRPMAFGLAALAVTAVDLYWVDSNFLRGYPAEQVLHGDPALTELQADTSQYRIFGLPGAFEGLSMAYYGFETVDGRADNELRQYRAYRGDDFETNPNFMAGLKQDTDGTVSGSPFLDLLNVKYIAFRIQNDPGLKIVRNASAMPRAFFVTAWQAVSDSDALHGLKAPGFNPRRLVYVSTPGFSTGGNPADSAGFTPAMATLRKINRQDFEVDAPAEGVLVTSDVWFPFWHVKVDGVEAPLLRADFAFRGVLLQPGHHEVEFVYRSPWIRTGLEVSLASAVALVLFAGVMTRRRFGARLASNS